VGGRGGKGKMVQKVTAQTREACFKVAIRPREAKGFGGEGDERNLSVGPHQVKKRSKWT